jgi:hypothetical protein
MVGALSCASGGLIICCRRCEAPPSASPRDGPDEAGAGGRQARRSFRLSWVNQRATNTMQVIDWEPHRHLEIYKNTVCSTPLSPLRSWALTARRLYVGKDIRRRRRARLPCTVRGRRAAHPDDEPQQELACTGARRTARQGAHGRAVPPLRTLHGDEARGGHDHRAHGGVHRCDAWAEYVCHPCLSCLPLSLFNPDKITQPGALFEVQYKVDKIVHSYIELDIRVRKS